MSTRSSALRPEDEAIHVRSDSMKKAASVTASTRNRRPFGVIDHNVDASGSSPPSASSASKPKLSQKKNMINKNYDDRSIYSKMTMETAEESIYSTSAATPRGFQIPCDNHLQRSNDRQRDVETDAPSIQPPAPSNDVSVVFRSWVEDPQTDGGFWTEEVEAMLTLKRANPILDESRDDCEEDETYDEYGQQVSREDDDECHRDDYLVHRMERLSASNDTFLPSQDADDAMSVVIEWSDRLPEDDDDGYSVLYNTRQVSLSE